MADHSLDRQPGIDRLASDINTLKQQLSELRTLQLQGSNALQPAVSPTFTASAPVNNLNSALFIYTYTPTNGLPLITSFHFTMYEGTIASGNEITGPLPRGDNYTWKWWRDWSRTDNLNVKDFVLIKNNTGSTQTICMSGNWRYFVTGGAGSS